MEHISEAFDKLEEMKEKVETFLEKVSIGEKADDAKTFLAKVNEEIKYFDNDDFSKEVSIVANLMEEFDDLDLNAEEQHYYDFGYFFNRKDSGSIYMALPVKLDTDDIDECVSVAVAYGKMEDEYVDNIVYVEELTREEVEEYGLVE